MSQIHESCGDQIEVKDAPAKKPKTLKDLPDIDYEHQMSLDDDCHDGVDHDPLTPKDIGILIQRKVDKRETKRWILKLGNHPLKIRKQYENVITFVLW